MPGEGGGVRVSEQHPSRLVEFIDVLHRVVGLPVDSDPNRWIMGVICVLYTVALVSGVVVLLPSLVKDFFALRVGRNLKRMWLDAHNVVGIVSLPFHLVIAFSAAVFGLHDMVYLAQDKFIYRDGLSATVARDSVPRPLAARTDWLPPSEIKRRVQEQMALWDVTPSWVVTSAQEAGLTNGYEHPSRLGSDRWVALFCALHHVLSRGPARPLVVVMVGTAAGKWAVQTVPEDSIVIHGELDETIPLYDVLRWAEPQDLPVTVVAGADHFFHRRLQVIKNIIVRQW